METFRFSDGTAGELGAMRIPRAHDCVMEYVRRFGLETPDFVMDNEAAWLHFRGIGRRRREWCELAAEIFAGAPIGAATPAMLGELGTPDDVITAISLEAWRRLPAYQQWQAFDNGLALPEEFQSHALAVAAAEGDALLRLYEESSLWQYMTGRSGDPLHSSGAPPLSDAAWEYLARVTMDLPFEHVSFLEWLLDHESLRTSEMAEIKGGIGMLVQAFLDRLRDAVRLEARVTEIAIRPDAVSVSWRSRDGLTTSDFDYVICTTPAPATAQIRFDPPLPSSTREALNGVSYFPAAKTLAHCPKRFWELGAFTDQDPIYGGGSYTDLPHQQCWYPSDGARPPPDDAEHYERLGPADDVAQSQSWIADGTAVSEEPGVFIAAYMWGSAAERFAASDDKDEFVLASVEKIHPWIRKADKLEHRVWDVGGGAFAAFSPGDHVRYQSALLQPYPQDQPRVYFGGEHLGVLHGWLQSAMQTALASAIPVLEGP